jgi:hypothetical protein
MTRKSLLGLWCVLLLALIATSLPAYGRTAPNPTMQSGNEAGSGPRITQAVDEHAYVTLPGNTRPEAKNAINYRGPASATMHINHILLFLQRSPQQEQALDEYIDFLNDRSSSHFHQWLTPEELGNTYGVASEDVQKITNWLESQGFVINRVYPNKMVIDFSGTVGAIGQAFHTQIGQIDVNGQMHLANISDPQVPAALAPAIKGFFSLNDFRPEPMYRVAPQYTFTGCSSTALPTEPGTCYAITPQDNETIYNLNPLYNAGISGQGQTIALIEDTDTYGTAGSGGASDWNTYRSTFGLTANFPLGSYSQIHPGCADPGTNGDDGEAAIDVEVASAIAPSAHIELVACASSTFTFGGQIALQNLINAAGPYPGVVSVSYGLCEAFTGQGMNAAFYQTYQQAAAQGISVFVSSGDEGPSSCSNLFSVGSQYDIASLGVTGWGESPYNVSVGGTDFEDSYNSKTGGAPITNYWSATNTTYFGSALSYIPEIPWNDACASVLISEVATGSFVTYGASPAICNNALYDTAATYLSTGAASGGASNCAIGAGGTVQGGNGVTDPQCQGYPKPSYQSGSSLSGGQAVYGSNSDGVRDVPDVSMFAANGVWGHYEVICWSDPSQTAGGATPCTGAPSTWAGFGGTSVAAPTMAAVQALVNQQTAESWGNPNPMYYQIAQNEYGTAGGSFQGSACNSSGAGGPGIGCAFNDVTQGDIDLACEFNATTTEHCYKPAGTHGVDSTDVITAAAVINGGTGYTSAPTCTIAGPTNSNPYKSPTGSTLYAGGSQATCTAAVNAGSTNAIWTVAITGTPAATWAGTGVTIGASTYTYVTALTGSTPNEVLLITTGTTGVKRNGTAQNLRAAVDNNSTQCVASPCFLNVSGANASATATVTTTTVTLTAINSGYAGNFNVVWSPGSLEGPSIIAITNTTLGQGPNYVSGITLTGGGSGYQPDTPITLTPNGGGSGAIAVANTSPGTASSSYQPAYGAAPGYDMATGLGTPNSVYLVNNCSWHGGSAALYGPTPGSTLTGSTATFQWCIYPGATNYWLDVGSTAGGNNYYQSGSLPPTTFAQTVNSLPTDGSTVYVTWWQFVGGSWSNIQYQYTAFGGGSTIGVITSPAPGSTLTGSSQMFTWNPGSLSTAYWIDAGSSPGGNNYFQSGNIGNVTSYTVTGLPTDGSTVYVTLYSLVSGNWLHNSYTYTAASGGSQGVLTTPTPGSQFTGSTVTFGWTAGAGASNYWLDVGSSSGGNQYFQSGPLGNVLTVTVNGLPTDGSTVYVTLYTLVGGNWLGTTYTYTAFGYTLGMMQTPVPGTTLSGNVQTFTWSAGSGATAYWMDIGSTVGGNDIYQSGNLGNVLTTTVNSLPANGSQIFVTLYSLVGGNWLNNQYTYISGP